ncbi:nucleoporin 37 [Thecamonas trahens ATCC 50062]|uniref:Nucleoporin 37 n=1 Tax=Thecamonas trahens ATCC 50062 TaxID=461836 RepID=A0A0L0DJC9_THETB|nr:nucleoporin 37 [Thecamonas trahens ATCC 50062]KNC52310.1 nucleoporin 37 [Thecamonas trahens ATCC 50062]|eukprot:XP_013762307.1 nucleoporin 37 [Thecamonas trahens ATCC 50062]
MAANASFSADTSFAASRSAAVARGADGTVAIEDEDAAARMASDAHLAFCMAGDDHTIRYYASDVLESLNVRVVLDGHESYVNSLAFSPLADAGDTIASTSDDASVKLFSLETQGLLRSFALDSAGKDVVFHPSSPFQLMVAEAAGLVSVLDLRMGAAAYSLLHPDGGSFRSVDWCGPSPSRIGGLDADAYFVWDIRAGYALSPLVHTGPAHGLGSAGRFAWSHVDDAVFATSSLTDTVKIWNCAKLDAPAVHSQAGARVSSLSWSGSSAALVSTGDDKLYCWLTY